MCVCVCVCTCLGRPCTRIPQSSEFNRTVSTLLPRHAQGIVHKRANTALHRLHRLRRAGVPSRLHHSVRYTYRQQAGGQSGSGGWARRSTRVPKVLRRMWLSLPMEGGMPWVLQTFSLGGWGVPGSCGRLPSPLEWNKTSGVLRLLLPWQGIIDGAHEAFFGS